MHLDWTVHLDWTADQAGIVELADPIVDPAGELTCRLAGERQTEDLIWPHETIGKQPEHTVGHRLGLSAARPRNDQHRLERCFDDGLLLHRREGFIQGLGDLHSINRCSGDRYSTDGRPREFFAHELTCLMMWMRQDPNDHGSRQ